MAFRKKYYALISNTTLKPRNVKLALLFEFCNFDSILIGITRAINNAFL